MNIQINALRVSHDLALAEVKDEFLDQENGDRLSDSELYQGPVSVGIFKSQAILDRYTKWYDYFFEILTNASQLAVEQIKQQEVCQIKTLHMETELELSNTAT